LGGLVKDYALRRGGEILSGRADGVPVLLDLGGDILAYGRKSPPWQVGVRHPLRPGELLGTLRFPEGGAVLTSGDYERFVEIGGRRYGHILDARTGLPVSGFAGLTVYLPDISVEHLPSAALVLLGRDEALARVRAIPGALAVWVGPDGSVETAEGPGSPAAWLAANPSRSG
jgi:thiamine biosynthesis lipoprotein